MSNDIALVAHSSINSGISTYLTSVGTATATLNYKYGNQIYNSLSGYSGVVGYTPVVNVNPILQAIIQRGYDFIDNLSNF